MCKPYISFAGSGFICVDGVYQKNKKKFLEMNGFIKKDKSHSYYKECNHEEMILLFQLLNDNKFAFSSGREWNPADIYEYYREKKLLRNKFWKVIISDGIPIIYYRK